MTEVFPDKTQALAGAVFNTCGQFGMSLGLAVIGVVSNTATEESGCKVRTSPEALEVGYRAGFWTAFALMLAIAVLALVGLRGVGKIGLKRD